MMTHLDFSYLIRSTIHTAVIGLTTKEATSSNERSSLTGKAYIAFVTQYSEYEPPSLYVPNSNDFMKATLFPNRAYA